MTGNDLFAGVLDTARLVNIENLALWVIFTTMICFFFQIIATHFQKGQLKSNQIMAKGKSNQLKSATQKMDFFVSRFNYPTLG